MVTDHLISHSEPSTKRERLLDASLPAQKRAWIFASLFGLVYTGWIVLLFWALRIHQRRTQQLLGRWLTVKMYE
jgi:hypothetical protein